MTYCDGHNVEHVVDELIHRADILDNVIDLLVTTGTEKLEHRLHSPRLHVLQIDNDGALGRPTLRSPVPVVKERGKEGRAGPKQHRMAVHLTLREL